MKAWREIAVPHEDVLKGTFQQSEFAADLAKVHEGTAPKEYSDPELFFERTFITEGMATLLRSVIERLSGARWRPSCAAPDCFRRRQDSHDACRLPSGKPQHSCKPVDRYFFAARRGRRN